MTKVVGFHVEGVPPSPNPHQSVLGAPDASRQTQHVGSPSPVIIPPNFGGEGSSSRHRDEDDVQYTHGVLESGSQGPDPASQEAAATWCREDEATQYAHGVQDSVSTTNEMGLQRTSPNQHASGIDPSQLATVREDQPLTAQQQAAAPAASEALSTTAPSSGSMPPSGHFSPAAPLRSVSDPFTVAAMAAAARPPAPARAQTPTLPEAVASSPVGPDGSAGTQAAGTAPPSQPATAAQPTPPPSTVDESVTGGKPRSQLTRAERREIHERNRAAKVAAKAAPSGAAAPPTKGASGQVARTGSSGAPQQLPQQGSMERAGAARSKGADSAPRGAAAAAAPAAPSATRGLALFSHLPPYRRVSIADAAARARGEVHPRVLRLGLQLSAGEVRGADARCVAMLEAFKEVVRDYRTPDGKTLQRDIVSCLSANISFLVECRPLGSCMGNAIKYLKTFVTHLGNGSEADAKEALLEQIDSYIKDKVLGATKVLVDKAVSKVSDGDVVLTYALSSVVLQLLLRAKQEGRQFRVVVVDSRPLLEGRELLRRLAAAGVSATYAYISSLSYVMKEATKVFLGAAAVLSNGAVISRVGSAMVALVADTHHVPVMICAESHKFHERMQLDSITTNELGDPAELAKGLGPGLHGELNGLQDWEAVDKLGVLNLMYDVMPCEYISMVCTEFGSLPPSSVPVILRESRDYSDWMPQS